MKTKIYLPILALLIALLTFESCGSVFISARLSTPPPWFHHNRIQVVRYIYFPDYEMYYDFSMSNYHYVENGTWLSVNILPNRFNVVRLKRTKQVKINNYYGDNLKKYHKDKIKRGNSTLKRKN